ELVIVIVAAFGIFIFGSIQGALSLRPEPSISDAHLGFVLVYESVVLVALSLFLHVRGWTPEHVGLAPHPRDFPAAFAMAIGLYVAYLLMLLLAMGFFTQLRDPASSISAARPTMGVVNVLAISVVNPLFEEVFVCGYIVAALRERRGPWTAINVS